jgi:hypothetical protein
MQRQANGLDIDDSIEVLKGLPYKKGEYASRSWGHPWHSLVSYPSKLKPSIAYYLVQLFSREGERILDPFSGVGTIPFEACSQGRVGIGSDLSPVAFHATRAKLEPPTIEEATRQLWELEKYITDHKADVKPDVEEEIISFYHSETLREILAARQFFLLKKGANYSFVMACTLHILHGNRPYALSRRSHNIMPWPPKGPTIYKPLLRSLRDKVSRMLNTPPPMSFTRGEALQYDATKLTLKDETIDGILTSPPFYGNRDFLRMNRIRLWFCGWNYDTQKEMKSIFLEHEKDIRVYDSVFKEFHRLLRSDSVCVMHLGVVKDFDMAKELRPIAESRGFKTYEPIYEDTSALESHGIRDRGATAKHQFLIFRKM